MAQHWYTMLGKDVRFAENRAMDLEELRLAVYRAFATNGRAPDPAALARQLELSASDVLAGLRRLAEARHLVLDAHGQVLMAHPFSAVPLGFAAMGTDTLWWGGCAWDSFALPHLLPGESSVLVSTRCPACRRPHVWDVNRDRPPDGDQVAHFLVPVAQMWDDVVHTCANQRLFCSRECVAKWLRMTARQPGYMLGLDTLWRLAQHWYDGRLDYGYVRREPSAAADYLRSVGLAGPFWGL